MNLLRKALAEAIGTFAIVFFGCGSLMIAERFPGSIPAVVVPIIFGLVVSAMIYALGHISGAHFNPAVTAGFAVGRHFPLNQVLIYWIAQFLGAITAIGLLSIILPSGNLYGATIPSIPTIQAIAWEAVLTFFLMFVIIAVATDTRAVGIMAGAAIGAAVMFDAYVGGPVTGASMNPARSLAPAIFQGRVDVLWIYFVGPVIGSTVAALTYGLIRCEDKTEEKAKGCC